MIAPDEMKEAAHRAMHRALRRGVLTPAAAQSCVVCSKRATALHHWSYEPEHHLDVVPVCAGCHKRIHAGIIPDPTSGAFWVTRTAVDRPATTYRPTGPAAIEFDPRGSCPWPEPAPEPVPVRLRRVEVYRAVRDELGAVPLSVLFAEAERRLRS